MAFNLFPAMLALDEATGDVARNAVGQVYDPADLARATPLAITDATGVTLAAATSNRLGVVQKFRVNNLKTVIWKSGPFEVEIVSIDALIADVNAAVATAAAAQSSAAASATAAIAAQAAQDTAVAAFVSAPGSATNTAVIAVAGTSGGGGGGDSVDTLSGTSPVGRAVMKAVDAAAGRAAIEAGTSNLAIGILATQAAAGNDVLRTIGVTPQTTSRPTTFTGGIAVPANSLEIADVAGLQTALSGAATPAGVVFQTDVYKPVKRAGDNVDGAWPTTRPVGNWLGMDWIGIDPDPSPAIMAPGDIRSEVV